VGLRRAVHTLEFVLCTSPHVLQVFMLTPVPRFMKWSEWFTVRSGSPVTWGVCRYAVHLLLQMVVPGNMCCCRTSSNVAVLRCGLRHFHQECFACGGVDPPEHPAFVDQSGTSVAGGLGFGNQRFIDLHDVTWATNQRWTGSHPIDAHIPMHIKPVGENVDCVNAHQLFHRGLADVSKRPEESYLHRNISL